MTLVAAALAATAAVTAAMAFRAKHRAIAVYGLWIFCANVARHFLDRFMLRSPALIWLHPGPPPPRQGTDLALWFTDQGVYLGLIAAVPALGMALFMRRRPWWAIAGAAAAALWLLVVLAYPTTRGPLLLELYWASELAGGIAAAGMYVMWLRAPKRELPAVAAWCGIALVSASLATTVLPSLAGERVLKHWPVVPTVHLVAFAAALALLVRLGIKEKAHA